MAYDPNSAILMKQYEVGHRRTLTDIANLREEVNNKISSVYKAKGSLPFASLTSALLVKENEGNVYNITDAFTSTADFAEGAGKKYNKRSNHRDDYGSIQRVSGQHGQRREDVLCEPKRRLQRRNACGQRRPCD